MQRACVSGFAARRECLGAPALDRRRRLPGVQQHRQPHGPALGPSQGFHHGLTRLAASVQAIESGQFQRFTEGDAQPMVPLRAYRRDRTDPVGQLRDLGTWTPGSGYGW